MLKIFAIDLETKERFEITDLYWFEEQGVHDFAGEARYAKYAFEVFVRDVMVYPPNNESHSFGGEFFKLTDEMVKDSSLLGEWKTK